MLIKTLPVGMLETNCYVVTDEKSMKCIIIDPGAESNTILEYIESHDLQAQAVVLTHGHFDHRMALDAVRDAADVPVYINSRDATGRNSDDRYKAAFCESMRYCAEGDIITAGGLRFTVMETPGHSPGSITLLCENALFTGDTLFCGDCGRTDLDGGSREEILKSLRRIAGLEGDYEIYPGHDVSTTLDNERAHNMDMKIAIGVM